MSTIEKNTEMSPGGTCSPELTLYESDQLIPLFPDYIHGVRTGAIEPFPDVSYTIATVRDSIHFREEQVEKNGATMYSQRLSAIIAKDAADRIRSLMLTSKNRWIVIFTDKMGVQKIIGDLYFGATLRFKRDNKTEMQSRNEMPIEFSLIYDKPAAEYRES